MRHYDPRRGPDSARVTMVEFGDFECPYCGAAEPTVRQVLATYPNDVALVFVNFPISLIHPYAMGAAEAFLAAGRQDKAWEMHDLMYAHQDALSDAELDGLRPEHRPRPCPVRRRPVKPRYCQRGPRRTRTWDTRWAWIPRRLSTSTGAGSWGPALLIVPASDRPSSLVSAWGARRPSVRASSPYPPRALRARRRAKRTLSGFPISK